MADSDNQQSARALLDSAIKAQRLARPGWLERWLEYRERGREHLRLEAGRALCREGKHDYMGWEKFQVLTIYDKQGDTIPRGHRYAYMGRCIRCQHPEVKLIHDY